MIFGGFQKLTLLDYPGKVACTLFTKGCNFRCPFCHNSLLVEGNEKDNFTEEEVLLYLKKRLGILEGVCISGGEPLMQQEIEAFIRKVKDMGYFVKLDTNGSYPDKLKHLVNEGLVDYVAMDIKNSFEKYAATAGVPDLNLDKIRESISFLLEGKVDYEFRTTVAEGLHTVEDIKILTQYIVGAKKYFLQNFMDSGNILGGGKNLAPVAESALTAMLEASRVNVPLSQIRGKN